jgi:Spy/CpxP family protein refolding chaperone
VVPFSRSGWFLGAALGLLVNTGQVRQARPDRVLWWQDEAIKKEIGLREDQVKRIDALYAKRARDLEPLELEFEKQRTELNRLMGDRAAGPAAIELQVARMEVPRAKMNESYFSMLYRMYLVLDVEQYKKLQLIFERQRDRGRGGGAAP